MHTPPGEIVCCAWRLCCSALVRELSGPLVPPTHRDCKPGQALSGPGLSRSPGCLCSSDEQQFKSNTRPSLPEKLVARARLVALSPCQARSRAVSQSVSYFTVPPRAHPSTGSQSGSATHVHLPSRQDAQPPVPWRRDCHSVSHQSVISRTRPALTPVPSTPARIEARSPAPASSATPGLTQVPSTRSRLLLYCTFTRNWEHAVLRRGVGLQSGNRGDTRCGLACSASGKRKLCEDNRGEGARKGFSQPTCSQPHPAVLLCQRSSSSITPTSTGMPRMTIMIRMTLATQQSNSRLRLL